MPNSQNDSWLSAHLYYNEPWEVFLVEAVAPYIETVLKTGIVQSYFFIRYWERGPHIRLRLKGESSALREVLKPNLIEHFNSYFETNPSSRTDPEYPVDFPDDHKWHPNNSVRFKTYHPEYERYGGNMGIPLSEAQFQVSSSTVLSHFVALEQEDTYQEVLGAGIRLHLGFVFSLGFSISEAIAFFEMIFENWMPSTFEIYEHNLEEYLQKEKLQESLALFPQSFEDQKSSLVPFHQKLWADLESGISFDSEPFSHWIKENQKISKALQLAASTGALIPRKSSYKIPKSQTEVINQDILLLWNIYADYVHMTNNRLGIMNQDEAYLAYLIKRSLEEGF